MQREKKTEIITLRVTPQVKERIRAKAREVNLTVTDYLCLCGLGKKIVQVDGLDQVLSELKAQGRNLNQLTTLANMEKRGGGVKNGGGHLHRRQEPGRRPGVRWAVCCGTPSRTKRRCGKGSGW